MADDDDQGANRNFYGRRHGRPLRPGRRSLLVERLPQLAVSLPPPGNLLSPQALFAGAGETWLEIGFGGGEHLAWQAVTHPDVGFIGCEPFVNGVASMLNHVAEANLGNVRIFADDARLLLPFLPDRSIGRVFILFADPWPKRRHHRRRIVAPSVLDQLARLMRDGGELRLATDHAEYGRWMLQHLLAQPAFEWLAESASDWRERPSDWPETRYEAKARAEGRSSRYFRFRRRPRSP